MITTTDERIWFELVWVTGARHANPKWGSREILMKDTTMIRRANMRYTFEDPEEFLERAPSNMQAAH